MDEWRDIHTYDRQTDRWTDRMTAKQNDGQTDKHKDTQTKLKESYLKETYKIMAEYVK